jgi:hypothetical protein
MMIPQKLQNQRAHDIGALDADLLARGLESDVLAQGQPGFLLDVEGLNGHGIGHHGGGPRRLFLLTEKNRAAMSSRAMERSMQTMGSVVGDTVAWSHSNKKAQPERYASRLGSGWHKEIVRLDAAMKSGDPLRVIGLASPFGARQAIARLPLVNGRW